MNKKQAAALSTLAYLDRPDEVTTLGEFVEHYIKHPEELPEKEQERHKFEKAIQIVKKDSYLRNLEIVGYTNNNKTGTKSGFVGYAFAETTSSKDGVVSFRGSENPFDENWNDWINNLEMETNPSSKQMQDAIGFYAPKDEQIKELKEKKQTEQGVFFHSKHIYSFTHDASLICSAFLAQYGIDLTKDNLHWWLFRALFEGLVDENKICKVMEIRSIDLSKIKDKEQKAHYRQLKRIYRLPDPRTEEEQESDMIHALSVMF